MLENWWIERLMYTGSQQIKRGWFAVLTRTLVRHTLTTALALSLAGQSSPPLLKLVAKLKCNIDDNGEAYFNPARAEKGRGIHEGGACTTFPPTGSFLFPSGGKSIYILFNSRLCLIYGDRDVNSA